MRLPAPVIVSGGERIGQVLIERSAGVEAHELHAKTHAEGGSRPPIQRIEQGKFELLPIRMNLLGLRVRGDAPALHDRVVAAGEDEAVAAFDVYLCQRSDWRQNDRQAAFLVHDPGVMRAQRAAIIVNIDIARDADNGAFVRRWMDRVGHGRINRP
jgi:hypothetical protein